MKTKWIAGLILLSLITLLSARYYLHVTEGFSLRSITTTIPYHAEWDTPPLVPEEQVQLNKILNQEFTYLGKGAQCYAFTSADDQWVIKFFKFKHLKPSPIVSLLPPIAPFKTYRDKKIAQKNQRFLNVFNAHKLAYDLYKNESGFFYLHLNQSQHFQRSVSVTDKIGRKWKIDLDSHVFVVQEKARPLRDEMTMILDQGDIPLAKDRIEKVFSLYLTQYHNGFYDWGCGVMHNNGFVKDKPIHFDVEKFVRDEGIHHPKNHRDHLKKIGEKFALWIEHNYPQYHEELKADIDDRIAAI